MSVWNCYTDEQVEEKLGRVPNYEFEIVGALILGERPIFAEKMGTDHWYFVDNGEHSSDRNYLSIEDMVDKNKVELYV